jgi:hypothetical protein
LNHYSSQKASKSCHHTMSETLTLNS